MSHRLATAACSAPTPPPLLGVATFQHRSWLLTALTEHGEQHYDDGEPLQDAYRLATVGPHILMAVSDGVSTASHSVEGAALAVNVAVDALASALTDATLPDEAMIRNALGAAHTAIQEAASQRGLPSGAFAATLALAVLTDDHVAAGSIGDSSLLALSWAGQDRVPHLAPFVSPPQSPSGKVFSISESGWERRCSVRAERHPRLQALVLATDGADNLFTTSTLAEGYHGFDAQRLADLPEVISAFGPRRMSIFWHAFLSDTEANNHDDRTILMAYRHDAQPSRKAIP